MEAEARAEAAALRESIQAAVAAEREACARTCERLAEERFAEFGVTEPDTNASYYTGRDADEYELHHEEDDACAQAIRAREPQDEPVCELIALDDGLGTVIAQWNEARAGWERECADGDKLCEALGISMTEGGSLQVAKMVNAIDEARRDQDRRVLYEADPYCPSCGHNRDKSAVSSIDHGNGLRSCQMCGADWREVGAAIDAAIASAPTPPQS